MRKALIVLVVMTAAACATTGNGLDKSKVAEGYYNNGLAYFQANNLERASVEFHRAIQTDSNNKMAFYGLGLICERQDKLAEAERHFKDAIDIDPLFSEAYNMLGVVASRQQKWKDALKYFNKAIENKLYATPHITYLNIGNMYLAQKDYGKAVDAFRESKRIVNQDYTVYRIGKALLEAGRVREAIIELQEGVAMAPKNPEMRLALGQAFLKNGDKRAALAEFRMAAELAPKTDLGRAAQDYIATIEKTQGK